jgi:hydrogenase maturation protease
VTGIVVIGVGNAYRGDDAVGLAVAERLRGRLPTGVTVLDCEQEPTRLLDAWQDADVALVVDAAASDAPPGTVHRFDASGEGLPAHVFRSSTHAFGVGDAVELARALGRLPERVVVYGVEGADFTAGSGLSTHVTAAVERLVDELEEEIRCTNTR